MSANNLPRIPLERLNHGIDIATAKLPKKKRRGKDWFEMSKETIQPLIIKRNLLRRILMADHKNVPKRGRLKKARKMVQRAVNEAKNKWVSLECDKVNTMNGKEVWKTVKKLKAFLDKPAPARALKMKRKDGTYAETPQENAGIMHRFLCGLYNKAEVVGEGACRDSRLQPHHNRKFSVTHKRRLWGRR